MEGLGEALRGPIAEVLEGIKSKWREAKAQEPFLDVLMGFVHAVDWKEPWIIGILFCHLALLTTALMTRKKGGIQGFLFISACSIIYLGEWLNKEGRQHWENFASQNYFDEQGVFFSALVSLPLLILLFILLINYLLTCCQLLIEAKRKELRFKARQRRTEKGGEGDKHTGGSAAGEKGSEGKKAE